MAPLWRKKLKFAFQKTNFLDWFIRRMAEVQNFSIYLNFTIAMVTKKGRQNLYKIEKLPFLAKFKALRDRIFKNYISAQLNTIKILLIFCVP